MRRKTIHQILVSREFGGAGDIALRLACHLRDQAKDNLRIWLPGEGRGAEKVRSLGLPLALFDAESSCGRSKLLAAVGNASLALRLRACGGGLAHVHSPLMFGALRYALRLGGVRQIVHVHLEYDQESLRWALRTPPDVIVTCADFLVDQVRAALPQSGKQPRIVSIPNAIDQDRFVAGDKREARIRCGAHPDRPLVIMLANLAPHKGQETAIQAVAQLRQQGVRVDCWLAGVDRSPNRAFEQKLRQLIEELNLGSCVSLLGFRDDTVNLLQAADMMVLPSTSEGLPLSILEAQATHLPVIAAPTAGIPQVITDSETGLLVPAHDVGGYANAIKSLLTESSLRQRVITAAARQSQQYSWAAYRRKMTDLYSEMLAG